MKTKPLCFDSTVNHLIHLFQPFHEGDRYHIETSPLICGANQWTDFYMITASVMKGLNRDSSTMRY